MGKSSCLRAEAESEFGNDLRSCSKISSVQVAMRQVFCTKPPRAHHCKALKIVTRVLGMLGHDNGLCFTKEWDISGKPQLKIFYVACGIDGFIELSIWYSLWLACVLISKNMTTIESHEAERAAWLARKLGRAIDIHSNSVQVRQCDKCSAHKPPRAHHCKVCRRCVLRMDHHCLWINNCVGYQNYKAFLVLVFYATIGSLYSTVMITGSALQREWDISGKPQLKIFYVACGILMVSLSLAFGTLFGWHVFLISKNMTTIESHEAEQAAWLARKSGQSYRHPFNVGVYRNITLILGPNMLTWLYPLAVSHLKDGTSFPTPQHSL
ncbi:probable protein S-acyltransferase 15 [Pistacia vera]|uniref:probable protein S-acyltransferase 15 n=1 Tax=Pistacia vera TaxID=55513 RepID=UPI0012633620|nr:probable protein S-acyltransferase 15 [Pistacia vera]